MPKRADLQIMIGAAVGVTMGASGCNFIASYQEYRSIHANNIPPSVICATGIKPARYPDTVISVGDTIDLEFTVSGIPAPQYMRFFREAEEVRMYLWIPEELELVSKGMWMQTSPEKEWEQNNAEAPSRLPDNSPEFRSKVRSGWDKREKKEREWAEARRRTHPDEATLVIGTFDEEFGPLKRYSFFKLNRPLQVPNQNPNLDPEFLRGEEPSTENPYEALFSPISISLQAVKSTERPPMLHFTEIYLDVALVRGDKVLWEEKAPIQEIMTLKIRARDAQAS